MEFPGLSGMEAMEILANVPDPQLTSSRGHEAKQIADRLCPKIVELLNQQRHPFLRHVKGKIPLELQCTIGHLIDEVTDIEHKLLGGFWKRRAIVEKSAQLIILGIKEEHGLKDALGELFLLYIRSRSSLKKRSAIGLFLATQTYSTMYVALSMGSPEYEAEVKFGRKFKNLSIAPEKLFREKILGPAKRQGAKWGTLLHKSLVDFCKTQAGIQNLASAFNRRPCNLGRAEFEMNRALLLCLDSFERRNDKRLKERADCYTQGSNAFIRSSQQAFAKEVRRSSSSFNDSNGINRALFQSSINELYNYFNEVNDFSKVNPAEDWKLEVDDASNIVPWPKSDKLNAPLRTRLMAEDIDVAGHSEYHANTVEKYRVENFTQRAFLPETNTAESSDDYDSSGSDLEESRSITTAQNSPVDTQESPLCAERKDLQRVTKASERLPL